MRQYGNNNYYCQNCLARIFLEFLSPDRQEGRLWIGDCGLRI
jgi:hypothetical protein